VLYWYT